MEAAELQKGARDIALEWRLAASRTDWSWLRRLGIGFERQL
jgi:hypothetical protein